MRLTALSSFVAISNLPRAASATVPSISVLCSAAAPLTTAVAIFFILLFIGALASATDGPKLDRPRPICGGTATSPAVASCSFISDSGLSPAQGAQRSAGAAVNSCCGVVPVRSALPSLLRDCNLPVSITKGGGDILVLSSRSSRGGVPPTSVVVTVRAQLRFLQPGVMCWQTSFERWKALRLP